MTKLIEDINKLKNIQNTIDAMLSRGSLALKLHNTPTDSLMNKWVLEPLHEDKDCSVGLVHIEKAEFGPCETHVHKKSREYLIVVSGKILLNINGRDIREVNVGECCAIDSNVLHYSRPLTDDTKMVYVCVPRDEDMPAIKGK